ncbi:hypothetical protein GY45DRAFT_1149929 [Cubamyces sp. BRFM 1775]|nr:hypothetical protein GY45DRAFT_1149929 [Cubamyces sp. BRFM 1775]
MCSSRNSCELKSISILAYNLRICATRRRTGYGPYMVFAAASTAGRLFASSCGTIQQDRDILTTAKVRLHASPAKLDSPYLRPGTPLCNCTDTSQQRPYKAHFTSTDLHPRSVAYPQMPRSLVSHGTHGGAVHSPGRRSASWALFTSLLSQCGVRKAVSHLVMHAHPR